jgi:hypothetical protein
MKVDKQEERETDGKKRYTNDDLVVLRVLGSAAAACWSFFRLSESTTTGIRSPRHGEIIKDVRIRAHPLGYPRAGMAFGCDCDNGTANAMAEEPR